MGDDAYGLAITGYISVVVPPTSTSQTILQGGGQLCGWSLRDVSNTQASQASGNAVAPAAGTTIASLTGLAAGTYTVEWTVGLQGAAAAADANNFELFDTAGNVIASVNPGAAGEYAQINAVVTVAAGQTIGVKNTGAGTAGVTYSADLAITGTQNVQTVCELRDGGNPKGEIAFTPNLVDTQLPTFPGIRVEQVLTLNVISGTVTGAVYINPSVSSQ